MKKTEKVPCPGCNGTGQWMIPSTCPDCDGEKMLPPEEAAAIRDWLADYNPEIREGEED